MVKAFSEKEKDLLRQRLIEQGYRLFSIYGLKKTNIEDIARAVGISKGAFYTFYESKEALFMDVIEEAEKRMREQVFSTIDLPGLTPRARLFAVLKKAFAMVKEIPLLKFIGGSDYDLLFRRVPLEKIREHQDSDRLFIQELFTRLQKAGIPIRVEPEQIFGLLYPLVLSILYEDQLPLEAFKGNMDLSLELIAAYCLGEVELQLQGLEGNVK